MTLLDQIREEYIQGQDFLRTKKLRQVRQLVLMNNLRRGDENIASSLLFSVFYRIHSDLYDNRLQIKFLPGEDSEAKKTELLNKGAIHDYREMAKATLDYDWNWDALFFGRGYVETIAWDSTFKVMRPVVVNPLMLVHDPYFSDIQSWRFYGKWILRSGADLRRLIEAGVITGINDLTEITSGVEEELWDYKVTREAAKEGNAPPPDPAAPETANGIYQILEFFTYDQEGRKVLTWVDKNFTKILRQKLLDLRDGEEGESRWPLVGKEVFREPHSTLAVSVPDLVEDKHRALNVLYNLSYLAAKDEANPIYAYNKDLIQDVSQLFQRQINQHIAVTGNPDEIIKPLRTSAALSSSLLQFMGILRNEATEPIGATPSAPPQPRDTKTATEAALLQQIADLTKSLQSKIMSNAEQEFWSHWYHRQLRHMRDTDKKNLALTSVTGVSFESYTLKDVKTSHPPKIEITSSKEAEFKQLVKRRDYMQLLPTFGQFMEPQGFRAFMKHEFYPAFDIDTATVDMILPKSRDEIQAEQENAMLELDNLADIAPTDDDLTHLYVHARAKNTAAKWAHYFAHEQQLADKLAEKQNAATMAAMAQPPMPGRPSQRKPTTEQDATAPLQAATEQSLGTPEPSIQ